MKHYPKTWFCGHSRTRPMRPFQRCPACTRQDARNARAKLGLLVLGFILWFVGCEARLAKAAASCAPYTPADGWTCEPPTRLRFNGDFPICVCAPKGVARE